MMIDSQPAATSLPATATTSQEANSCANCNQELAGKYCHQCGERKIHGHDLEIRHFMHHAMHELTHLDSKVFATLRYLFTRPGFLTQEYIAGRRGRYMKPLALFLITSAVFLLASSFVMISAFDIHQIIKADRNKQADAAFDLLAAKKKVPKELLLERVQETVHRVATGAQLANVLAMAGLLAFLFRRHYFVEHLIFSLHFLSFTNLAAVLLSPLYLLVRRGSWPSFALGAAIKITVCIWLIVGLRRVYMESKKATTVKAIVAYTITQVAIVLTQVLVIVAAVLRATIF